MNKKGAFWSDWLFKLIIGIIVFAIVVYSLYNFGILDKLDLIFPKLN